MFSVESTQVESVIEEIEYETNLDGIVKPVTVGNNNTDKQVKRRGRPPSGKNTKEKIENPVKRKYTRKNAKVSEINEIVEIQSNIIEEKCDSSEQINKIKDKKEDKIKDKIEDKIKDKKESKLDDGSDKSTRLLDFSFNNDILGKMTSDCIKVHLEGNCTSELMGKKQRNKINRKISDKCKILVMDNQKSSINNLFSIDEMMNNSIPNIDKCDESKKDSNLNVEQEIVCANVDTNTDALQYETDTLCRQSVLKDVTIKENIKQPKKKRTKTKVIGESPSYVILSEDRKSTNIHMYTNEECVRLCLNNIMNTSDDVSDKNTTKIESNIDELVKLIVNVNTDMKKIHDRLMKCTSCNNVKDCNEFKNSNDNTITKKCNMCSLN